MASPKIEIEPAAAFVLEQNQRLSQSILWELTRNYFQQQGIGAWREGAVPHYVTNNPFIASAYARVVSGFLRDCQAVATAPESVDFPPLDPSQPVYIIELGAGSGRLAYHFLKKFLGSWRSSTLKDIPFKYVMTDLAQQNLDYWDAHPWLKPFVDQGHLDFARFDAGRDQGLTLVHSGDILSPGSIKNPVVVLANYFFDSIPQDAFCLKDGRLYENLVTVTSPQREADLSDPDLPRRVKIDYTHQLVEDDYYEDPEINTVLEDYQRRITDSSLSFPYTGLKCIGDLRRLSAARLLLLSADMGTNQEENLPRRGKPAFSVYGGFSMAVNYHALGQYVRHRGGQVLHTADRHTSLNVPAFLFGNHPNRYAETRQAYGDAIEQFGPDEFSTLIKAIRKHCKSFTLEQVLASLRLGGWDANIFLGCFPALMEQVNSAGAPLLEQLYYAVRQVWDTYYPIGEARDLAFHLGALLYKMGYYHESLDYFQHSVYLYGPNPRTSYNMGMCHYLLHDWAAGARYLEEALELDPGLDAAREFRDKIQSEITRPAVSSHIGASGENGPI